MCSGSQGLSFGSFCLRRGVQCKTFLWRLEAREPSVLVRIALT